MEPERQREKTAYWWRLPAGEPPAGACRTTGQATPAGMPATMPSPGDFCPACRQGTLSYDGLFLLTCDQCHQVAESGCFT